MDADSARIGFIGFGNMARALARGLVGCAHVDGGRICATALHFDKLEDGCAQIGAVPKRSASEVADASDILVVAVKPYLVRTVVEPLADKLNDKVLLSVAYGCDFAFYEEFLPEGVHHLSVIPNTPVSIGKGAISCETTHSLDDGELACFEELFGTIALLEWVDGPLLDVASAVAGCGPAFAALFIEALGDAGVKHGLSREAAYRLSAQMMAGTAGLFLEEGQHPGAMKDAVCSPGGTTIRGVAALERAGFRAALIDAVDAALEG